MDAAYRSLVCLTNPLSLSFPSSSHLPLSICLITTLSLSIPHPLFFLPSSSYLHLVFALLFSLILVLTCPCVLSRSSILSLSPQVDSMDNFTPSNTPSREDDPKSHLKSRSRSPSMASDMEPIEVRQSLSLPKKCMRSCIEAGILPGRSCSLSEIQHHDLDSGWVLFPILYHQPL